MKEKIYHNFIFLLVVLLCINLYAQDVKEPSVTNTQQEALQRLSKRHPHSIIISAQYALLNHDKRFQQTLQRLGCKGVYVYVPPSPNILNEVDMRDIALLKPEIVRFRSIATTTEALKCFELLDECKALYIGSIQLPQQYDKADLAYLEEYNKLRSLSYSNPVKDAIYDKGRLQNKDLSFLIKMPKVSKLVLAMQTHPDDPTFPFSSRPYSWLITVEGIDILAQITNLTDLEINSINADDLPYLFTKLTKLRRLVIRKVCYPEGWNDHMYFWHYDTAKLCKDVIEMKNLETLCLHQMPQLNAVDLSFFALCPRLKELSLYGLMDRCVPKDEMDKFRLMNKSNPLLNITGAEEVILQGFEMYSCPICTRKSTEEEGGIF